MIWALMLAWSAEAGDDVPKLATHHSSAGGTLATAWSDTSWWADAWTKKFDTGLFDEIRLKPVAAGYIPLISGEGDTSIPHSIVADVVFLQMTRLPEFMSGAKAVTFLGAGYDPVVDATYRDTYFFVDLGVFYMTWSQRAYRKTDGDRTFLWYEQIDEEWVDAAIWKSYQTKVEQVSTNVSRRWALNSIVPVGDIFGMFVVEPGRTHETRITLITRLEFGDDAGWVANWGSELPSVLKAGLKSGFDASVAICKSEMARKP